MTQGTLGAAYRKLASPQQYIDPELIADWEWATVTSVSPLRVRRDGDSSASGTPASLVGVDSLAVTDRVMTVIVKGSLIVIGRYGGDPEVTIAPPVRARMVKTSTQAYSASTWTKIISFDTTEFADGITADLASGSFTVTEGGFYDLTFFQRWVSYGSVYRRQGAIVKGTAAPLADNSNVIEMTASSHNGWYATVAVKNEVELAVGDVITYWVWSDVASTFNNTTTTPVPSPTTVTIRKSGGSGLGGSSVKTVSVTGLAAGEAPTVTFAGTNLAFGIPKGDKGDKGSAGATAGTKVTGSSGTWSWWYRDIGDLVEVYATYAATLAAQGTATVSLGLPAGWTPSDETPMTAVSNSGTYPVSASLSALGAITVRCTHTASITGVIVHVLYVKSSV